MYLYEVILYNFGSVLVSADNKKQARKLASEQAQGYEIHSITRVA